MSDLIGWFGQHILTLMIFAPTLGALVIMFLPSRRAELMKSIAAFAALVPVLGAIYLYKGFSRTAAGFQFLEDVPWIDAFNIHYTVAVDGISVTMVILTALLSWLCIFASWNIEEWKVNRGIKGYFALFLLLETGMMGVFCALDFFLFYVFWEVMLLPMFFLIGIWGGGRREYSAIKFFLYTLLGSVLMLVVMLALYFTTEPHTFDIRVLMEQSHTFSGYWWKVAFLGLFVAFAIKVPVFPFHTWLPDAHVDAPTPVSVILAGVLLKMGTYGLMRISYPILPEAARWFAPAMLALGVINIIYGALCAMAQIRGARRIDPVTKQLIIERDWKKLVAYSSVSHMGFCLIGLAAATPAGMTGALFQMWNHGCITGMLFLLVGVIYDRVHHRNIDGFGGLWVKMPYYGGITAFAFFASLGLPGLSGFISELLCFLGAFNGGLQGDWTFMYFKVLTAVSVLGVVFGAAYFLWSYQRIFLGPLNEKYKDVSDMNGREAFTLVPLALIILVLGIYPRPILDMIQPSINYLVQEQVKMPWVKPNEEKIGAVERVPAVSLVSLLQGENAASKPAEKVSIESVLNEMIDLQRLTVPPDKGSFCRQFSSYDRRSVKPDDGHDAEGWFANNDCGNYLRTEKKDGHEWFVMADMAGPGCIVRIWSANPEGNLRIYTDGDVKPALEVDFKALLTGKVKPFLPPMGCMTSLGGNLYFPIPYQKYCKIACDKGGQYYHVGYRTYPSDTSVISFSKEEVEKNVALVEQVRKNLERINKEGYLPDLKGATKVSFELKEGKATVSLEGPQTIERFEVKVEGLKGKELETALRETVLRITWDGSSALSVWSPLGDFFGTSPGWRAYHSIPMGVTSEGVSYCNFPMPFAKFAKIEIVNEGKTSLHVSGAVYVRKDEKASEKLYFHAQFRGRNHVRTRPFTDWTAVKGKGGCGRYVGLALVVRNPVALWWGEGDEKVYVDEESFPSTFGTGSEDYFGYAWCCPQLFTHAYHNQTRCDGPGNKGYTSVNRFHIVDDIPFHTAFQFDIEIWHHRAVVIGYFTVAYWYATPGFDAHIQPVEFQERELLDIPPAKKVKGVQEGEELKILGKTGGVAEPQVMGYFGDNWSGDAHLWWHEAKEGDTLRLEFHSDEEGEKTLVMALTKAPDYGIVKLSVNGNVVAEKVDLYAPRVSHSDELKYPKVALKKGANELKVEIVGTNLKANPKNYMFGLDYVRVE